MGGSVVPGMLGAFLFLRRVAMNPTWEAEWICLRVAQKKMRPRELLERHRSFAKEIAKLRQKVQNPVNLITGKPLGKNTLKGYTARLRTLRKKVALYNVSIRILRGFGSFGRKTQTELSLEQRFINEILSRHISDKRELSHLRDRWINERHWKKKADHWKKECSHWRLVTQEFLLMAKEKDKIIEELKYKMAVAQSTGAVKTKQKVKQNNIGLKIIQGGTG